MKFVILTGMSGAGKSTAIKMMEDIGYYCVDNQGAIYLPQQTTEGTEKTYVTTTSSVNMREKPDKNANIINVIGPDVKIEFVSEDNGWTQVIFQGQTGYVSSDYVKSDMADSTTDSGTSGDADSAAQSQ